MKISSALFAESWQKYLLLLASLTGVGFLSSGVVTWIAANWDYFDKFSKLYATQGLFFVSMAAGMVCYYREYRKLGQVRLKFVSSSFFFIAAVLIGALLALIGQIYQTGADPWQLFALWSLLQIPLFLALPNTAAVLLLLATGNLGLALYLELFWLQTYSLYLMILLNLCFVILSEIFNKTLHDQDWHISSKVSNTVLIGYLLLLCASTLNSAPLVWLLSAVMLYYYKRQRHDLFNQSGYWACLLFSIDIFLLNVNGWNIGGVLLATIITLGAAAFLGIHLKKQYQQQGQGTPWPVQILFTSLAILATLLLIILLFVADIFEPDHLFLMTSLAFLAIGAALYAKKANEYASGLLIMVGLGLYVFHYLFNDLFSFRPDEAFSARNWDLLGIIVISLLCYLFIATNWVKTGSLILLLFILLYTFGFQNHYLYGLDPTQEPQYDFWYLVFDYYAGYWLALGSLILFCLSLRPWRYHAHIQSAAWAFWLVYIGFIAKPDIYISLNSVEANPLSAHNHIREFFHIITNSLFTAEGWRWTTLILLLICLSPVLIHLWISRQQHLKIQSAVTIALLLAVFGLAFIASPGILLGFALLLMAYPNHNRLLFGCALLAIIGFLAKYYYWLGLPLLYKSFLLLANALLFLLAALYLQRQCRRTSAVQTAAPHYQGKIGWFTPSLAALTLLLTLAVGNFSIQKYENVLNNGKTVILALAPIDPRSIMQGDYMELNYNLLNQVRSEIEKQQEDKRIEFNVDQLRTIQSQDSGESYTINEVDQEAYARFKQWLDQRPTQLYALLKQNPDGTSTLCRLAATLPTDYHDCLADIAIKLRIRDYRTLWNLKMPGQQFFFAEGQAAHFGQAQYGEFRVLNGTALLARLLDSEMRGL
ncbi:GDYXXLXY domain-containing protein [Testudinibacter sp. P80/BLE/0925]|uniref:GDYXXLXY domain-containing protein n=1 Tax=Testudinibacter sp. TW-1 TaxID=3417757 RepID=UPI003D35E7D7